MLAIMSLAAFLSTASFPPPGPLPPFEDAERELLLRTAQGAPGQPVWPGLFPRPPAKLGRLLLASRGHFPAQSVLASALGAYPTDRPRASREKRCYDAHDAFAAALVHPGIDAKARARLVEQTIGEQAQRRGWRSRKKSFAIVRWAVRQGYVDRGLLSGALAERAETPPPKRVGKRELDSHPEGATGAIECFAAVWPRFRARLFAERKAESWFDYTGIADMGRRHLFAFRSGCKLPWVQEVFDVMEHVLTHGDDGAQNLVVVGLMEAVQGWAYKEGEAGDRYEAKLGPQSRRAWVDLLEGWHGKGIRSLEDWRKLADKQDG